MTRRRADKQTAAAPRALSRSACSCGPMSASAAQVKVLYFARSADLAALREESVSVTTPTSGRGLWAELQRRHPSLSELQGALVLAVRQEFVGVDDDQPLLLGDGDEVAVVPPLSGG